MALAATERLTVADRASVKEGDTDLAGTTFGTVVSTGSLPTELGVSAAVGDLWSKPSVTGAHNAQIEGDARSTGAITLSSGADVTGVMQAGQVLPVKPHSFHVDLPASGSSVMLEPDQTGTLSPGSYGLAMVKTSATLKLEGGSYYFDDLSFESGARLVLDDTEPVTLYVRKGFTWRGRAEREGDASADKLKLLVIALGNSAMPLESAFRGTVVAPNATLLLQPLPSGTAHWGAFFGKQVQVEADVVIHHHRFPWSGLLPPEPIEWLQPPAVLDPILSGSGGSGENATETALETPVLFEVPEDVWVTRGNAGNGTLTISVRAPGQPVETCTYQGGSSVAHPVTELDRAKGLRYMFSSCTGGIKPGGEYLVDWVRVEVVSADPESLGTAVSVPVGRGCDATLPPPMTPEEVVVMRENFDWRTVDALPETDPEGHPALWHALIYLDHVVNDSADPPVRDQLDALDAWRVFYSPQPLSRTYVTELAGKCGRVSHATDGKGVVVYAVLPAKLFNILRSFAIEAVLAGVEPPFKFIVPSSPEDPEYFNADGSLKYTALGTSGYADWLAALPPQEPYIGESLVNKGKKGFRDAGKWIDDNIIDPVSDGGQEGFSYATSGWDSAIDWAANAMDDGWEGIQLGLSTFVGWFSTKVDLTLDFSFLNRDPNLPAGSPMMRLWGNRFTGTATSLAPDLELIPRGARARVRQWGWGFLPVMSQSPLEYSTRDVNNNPVPEFYDKTTIKALRDDDGRGDGALCVELDNSDAMLTSDLIPNEVCDFGLGLDDIPTQRVPVRTSNKDLHALTQVVDSADYAQQVIDYDPHKVDVLIGRVPNELTGIINNFPNLAGGHERAMTLCLDFPSVGGGAITLLTGGLGAASGPFGAAAGVFAGTLLTKDIWWPDENEARNSVDSRGVMTHEYGHFLMCSMMYDHEHGSALTALMERMFEGANDSRDDDVALATEAFADTFTMQVVGGSNYIQPEGAAVGGVNFCVQGPCMDRNYRGVADYVPRDAEPDPGDPLYEFYDELARYQSLIHDAFDRNNSNARGTLAPWNGDVWSGTLSLMGPLAFSPTGYLAFDDEDISLPGPLWFNWVKHYTNQSGAGVQQMMRGLSLAMEDGGVDWCNRCDLFALHEGGTVGVGNAINPTADRPATPSDRWQRWQQCAGNGRLTDILGDPPEPWLNLDNSCQPCPNWQFAQNGSCSACAPGEIARGDHCEACPPGSIPGPSNQCLGCASNEISVGGDCVPCRQGEGADHATNTCVECPADVVIDWNDVPTDDCVDSAEFPLPIDYGSISPPGDVCPGELWYEIRHLDELLARGGTSARFFVEPVAIVYPEDEFSCTTRQHQLEQYRFSDSATALWQLVENRQVNGVWDETGPIVIDKCRWPDLEHTIEAADITGGADTVRFVARSLDYSLGPPFHVPALFAMSSNRHSSPECEIE